MSHGDRRASFTGLRGERKHHLPKGALTGFQQCCQNFSGCPGETERRVVKSMFSGLFVPGIPQPARSLLPPNCPVSNQVAGIPWILPLAIQGPGMQNSCWVKRLSCKWVSKVPSAAGSLFPSRLPPTSSHFAPSSRSSHRPLICTCKPRGLCGTSWEGVSLGGGVRTAVHCKLLEVLRAQGTHSKTFTHWKMKLVP